ncbi:MAG: hypothetical protein ACK559_34540, partial [bacterium]
MTLVGGARECECAHPVSPLSPLNFRGQLALEHTRTSGYRPFAARVPVGEHVTQMMMFSRWPDTRGSTWWGRVPECRMPHPAT